jgi:hypothetical protein
MVKTFAALAFVLYCGSSAFGQTASEIEKRYGQAANAYSVSEHILMTPQYNQDGQVCRMELYPRRISRDTEYLTQSLPFEELRDVLNVLVPPSARGAKQADFGTTDLGSPAASTTYAYENVTLVFISSFTAPDLSSYPKARQKEFSFPIAPAKREQSEHSVVPTLNDFRPNRHIEIVDIKINNRPCGSK